jgi:two-component system NtrC family sensor kinase
MPAEKILLIEDSSEVRDYIADFVLRPGGYDLLTATDGSRGLELIHATQPSLVVADIKLPGLSGLELAETLRREGRDLPIILITAVGSEETAREALRAGAADYLIKPFRPDELLDSIRRALEVTNARREKARMQAELTVSNAALVKRLKEMETLIGIGRNVISVLDIDQVLLKVVEAAVNLTSAEEGSLLLLDERTQELTMRAAKNFDDQFVRTFRLRSDNSLAGQVLRTGEPVLLDQESPQKIKTLYFVHSLVYVPLKVHGRTIGVLGVDNRRAGRAFTRHDQRLLQALGDYAAIAIENARLYTHTEAERAQFETILKETEDGVIVVDGQNRLILMNPTARAALGVNGVEVAQRDLTEVIRHTEVRELFHNQSRQGEVKLDDGRVFNAHLTSIAGVGQAMVLQDITHLKELDRIKSEFVTTVSHDLRSPLTAILGYVELISRSGPMNDQQVEFVRRIQFSVQSITTLVTDLLDLGRIEAGFDAQKEVTHLALVLRYAVDGLRPQAEAKHQNLNVSVPADLPRVLANPPRLRQMLSNLLDNAVKYTPENGTVTLTARAEGDLIILAIGDSGIGIPPADQPYIFDKFFRASNARQGYMGTGLGLSIVKSIVENHGGRIWLDSKPDEGTTFTVMLPKYQETGALGKRGTGTLESR